MRRFFLVLFCLLAFTDNLRAAAIGHDTDLSSAQSFPTIAANAPAAWPAEADALAPASDFPPSEAPVGPAGFLDAPAKAGADMLEAEATGHDDPSLSSEVTVRTEGDLAEPTPRPAANGTTTAPAANGTTTAPAAGDEHAETGAHTVGESAPPAGLDPIWDPLISRLAKDGFGQAAMQKLYARLGPDSFSSGYMAAKILELYGVPGVGIKREGQAAPELPAHRPIPPERLDIGACRAMVAAHAAAFKDIQERYGVPPSDILAILLVETGLGGDLGDDTALRALSSMAMTDSPAKLALCGNSRQVARLNKKTLQVTLTEKSEWAYNEVKSLIVYADKLGIDAAGIPASMYGAIGLCQFMPSNIKPYGFDGNGDGKIDLFTLPDVFYSVARYLDAAGRREAKTPKELHSVFYAYNHDNLYADRVLTASQRIAKGLAGKLGDGADPLAGLSFASARVLDPSLRGQARFVPLRARIEKLGSYDSLLTPAD